MRRNRDLQRLFQILNTKPFTCCTILYMQCAAIDPGMDFELVIDFCF